METHVPCCLSDKDQFLCVAAVGEDAARCKEAVSIFARVRLTGVQPTTVLELKAPGSAFET